MLRDLGKIGQIQYLRNCDHVMKAREVAQVLGVSSLTIYRLVKRQQIPHSRIGTSVTFDPHELALWLEGWSFGKPVKRTVKKAA